VLLRFGGRRAEDREPHDGFRFSALMLRALEIGEPFLEGRTLRVTLAHRCHTLSEGR